MIILTKHKLGNEIVCCQNYGKNAISTESVKNRKKILLLHVWNQSVFCLPTKIQERRGSLSWASFFCLALMQKIRVYSKEMRQFANSHIILPYPSIKMAAEKKAVLFRYTRNLATVVFFFHSLYQGIAVALFHPAEWYLRNLLGKIAQLPLHSVVDGLAFWQKFANLCTSS